MEITSNETFKYKQDVSLRINEIAYSVNDLLSFSDSTFDLIYAQYEIEINKQLTDMQSKPMAALMMMAISGMINIMERVVLERRIAKLEEQSN